MRLTFYQRNPSRLPSRQTGPMGPRGLLPPPPQPRELVDVLGVGATETVGGVALTLLSLERYREGCVAHFRLFRVRERVEDVTPNPQLKLAVMPEGTEPYRVWRMGGTGGGNIRELEYRQSYAIVPAPPSVASDVFIEVREILWERLGAGTREVVSVDTGPWRFSVTR